MGPATDGLTGSVGASGPRSSRHQGARTPNARTAVEATRTMPNHTSMLTGRRVDTDLGGHGVTFNTDNGSTVHRALHLEGEVPLLQPLVERQARRS